VTSILFTGEWDVFDLKKLVVSSWALGCVAVTLGVFHKCRKMGENQNFINAEVADMHFVYSLSNGNCRYAQRIYQERYE